MRDPIQRIMPETELESNFSCSKEEFFVNKEVNYPLASSAGWIARKSFKFSEKQRIHGMWNDNSLSTATKKNQFNSVARKREISMVSFGIRIFDYFIFAVSRIE